MLYFYIILAAILTVVGAGRGVFGAGLADDVLVDLVPFVLIVTPAETHQK